jgi:hypothetical protein
MPNRSGTILIFVSLLCLLVMAAVPTPAQNAGTKKAQVKVSDSESKVREADDLEAQRRAFAVSLITSLTDEANSYYNQALRPRVLARAAEALWDADSDKARLLFRRAWAAAEKGDAEELTLKAPADVPPQEAAMVNALRRAGGNDLRMEVLRLAARRDRSLGEEFLNKLKEKTNRETSDAKDNSKQRNSNDGWSSSEAVSRRLQLASDLLDKGEIERALEFAAPALDTVTANSIGFLSTLRGKRPETADKWFALLLARAEFDSLSDANTASGLSSYVFTPGLYVTFFPDGHSRWSQPEETTAPPNLAPGLRNRFFQTAASILLRPLPPPDQDFTSSGRTGKYMVIKRLLPLFDQYAPDSATALRAQLAALKDEPRKGMFGDENPLINQGLQPSETVGTAMEKMQGRLDRAKTSGARDAIYAEAAVALANQGDARAPDLADKIDDSDRRAQVRGYVDFEFVRRAIEKKDAQEATRIAKAGQLSHAQRAWAYTQAARLLMNSQRQRSLEILEDAADETRRIEGDERARLLIAVATQFVTADPVRAWEMMGEVVKAANSSETFTGESVKIRFPMMTMGGGLKIIGIGGEDFGLSGILRLLGKNDLYRAIDLARSFKNEAPRATATLAVVSAVLEKQPAGQIPALAH